MAITKVTRNMLTTGIVDNSNATAITIDSSENVGIGVTPEANWRSTVKALDLGATGAFWDGHNYSIFANNVYEHTDTDRKHKQNGFGSSIEQYLGTISFNRTTSGSADAVISGSTTMFLDTSGNVGIGTATPSTGYNANRNNLVVYDASAAGITINSNATDGSSIISMTDGTGTLAGEIHYVHDGDYMQFKTATAERMRIDSSGNVGIGTTSPHEMLHVEGVSGTEVLVAARTDDAGALASYYFKTDSTGTDVRKKAAFIFKRDDPGTRGTGALHICVDGANDEGSAAIVDSKMKFDAGGEISITKGRTNFSAEEEAFSPGSHNGHMIDINGQSASGRAATNTQTHRSFLNPNGTVGTISTNGSATAYNTSSDYRLKENVVTNWDGTTLLKQLKPSKFNFKTDASTTVHGFLAHEVSSIVPEAVTGEKDAVYTAEEAVKGLAVEGQPKYQGIDQAKLVPLLVKTIQELEARITTLEG